jgi:hypothetical protein
MAIEKVNEEINLEIEPNSAQEIDKPRCTYNGR